MAYDYGERKKDGLLLSEKLLRLLYPPKCASCGCIVPDGLKIRFPALCPDCLEEWKKEKERSCPDCHRDRLDCICAPPVMSDGLLSMCAYSKSTDSVAKRMILLAKDRRIDILNDFLASELADFAGGSIGDFDVMTYAPRSAERVRIFGVDQSLEISKRVAAGLRMAFMTLLTNIGSSEQKKLSKEERNENASSAYRIASPWYTLEGKRVVLFDDICTTGSTLSSCCEQLRAAGAEKIVCLTIARNDSRG